MVTEVEAVHTVQREAPAGRLVLGCFKVLLFVLYN